MTSHEDVSNTPPFSPGRKGKVIAKENGIPLKQEKIMFTDGI
jgi:hypothetical protein